MERRDLFVFLSKSFLEHIPNLSGNAIKIYIYLLLSTKKCKHGSRIVVMPIVDVCLDLNISRATFYKAMKYLSPNYMKVESGKNDCSMTKFTIYNPPRGFPKNKDDNTKDERSKMSSSLRYDIMKRDSFTCVLCGSTREDDKLEVDHIIPISKGGKTENVNLRTLCHRCNRGKFNKIESEEAANADR